jgi:hypothetical protein
MTIRISATHSSRLPKLGWLAAIDFPARVVSVVCGQGVEASDDFVVEGVWDGPFHEGGFHRASHFFGSGLRIDGERVFIIPSHALVDRVLLAWRGDITLASNSLLLLLAATGDSLDPSLDYRHACNAITAGVRKYDPLIPLGDAGPGPVRQGFRVPQVLGQEGLGCEDLPPRHGRLTVSAGIIVHLTRRWRVLSIMPALQRHAMASPDLPAPQPATTLLRCPRLPASSVLRATTQRSGGGIWMARYCRTGARLPRPWASTSWN